MATLEEIMAKATPVQRTVSICVAGTLYGEYETLLAQMSIAHNDENLIKQARLAGQGEFDKLQAEKDRLEAELKEATFEFTFRAVTAKAWSDLLSNNAKGDGSLDMENFAIAAVAATCVSPEVRKLVETLSPAQQGELVDAAWEVNTSVPKGLNFSAA